MYNLSKPEINFFVLWINLMQVVSIVYCSIACIECKPKTKQTDEMSARTS